MRKLPETLHEDGLLVGWSLETGHRKSIIGFKKPEPGESSPALTLEPILDTGEGHLATIAPTGAGKGTGCIIPALLRYSGPVVVVDPKGENYAVTSQRRRDLGHEVILLDPFNITGAEIRHRFNPFDLADPSSDCFIEDVATLANLISVPQNNVTGDYLFWDRMGKTLITAAIIDVLTMSDSDDPTLTAVRNLINLPFEQLQERAVKWQSSENTELKNLTSMLQNPADSTMGGYIAHAIHQLDFIKGDQMAEHLSSSDLDLNKIYDGSPLSIYLVLPPDKLESHSSLLRLWIGTIISVITRRRHQPEKHTLLLIDEAAQLGTLPQLRQAITLLRGYGVRVWTFWQDISQIKNLYYLDWETILNNCRVQQYFGATTGVAAQAVSYVSGYGSEYDVMDLESDEMILNIAGDEPVIAAKPNYLRDPAFKGLYTNNPFYAGKDRGEEYIVHTRPFFTKTGSPAKKHREKIQKQAAIIANRVFIPVSSNSWETLQEPYCRRTLELIGIENSDFLEDPAIIVRRCELPFYKDYNLYEVEDSRPSPANLAYYLINNDSAFILDGKSDVIHNVNAENLELNRNNILLYLKFFCTNVHGDGGRFIILDDLNGIEWMEKPDENYINEINKQIRPPRVKKFNDSNEEKTWEIEVELLYETAIFTASMSVSGQSGMVMMEDDNPIAGDLPVITDVMRLRYIGSFDKEGDFHSLR